MKVTIRFLTSAVLVFIAVAAQKLDNSIFPSLPITVLETDNLQCKKHADLYLQSLENSTLWAYEMWDATAKSSSGVLRGTIFQLGHYEQCLTAEAPFRTKYCLAFLQAKIPEVMVNRDPLSLDYDPYEHVSGRLYPHKDKSQQMRNFVQVGWCVPASCSSEDLNTFLNFYINDSDISLYSQNVTYSAHVSDTTCSTKDDYSTIDIDVVCFCILSLILVVLTFVATIFTSSEDEKDKKTTKESLLFRIFQGFSARKNFCDLTRKDEDNSALGVLYGIRTMCIFFIIIDHRFGTFTSSALMNFNFVETQFRAPFAPFIFHGDLFVDTFFIMSGLLVTYGMLNQLNKRKINPGFVILMRYLRLTPAYAFVVFYYASIFIYTGSGPFWKVIVGQEMQDCRNNWWANLLYINNYVDSEHICMTHSWYLPCDFHYFIIAVGLSMLLKKDKRMGFTALAFLTMASIAAPFAVTMIYQRPPLLHFYPEFLTAPKSHPDFQLTYIKTHTRATSYCIGIFAGYLYYQLKGQEFYLSRLKSYALTFTSITLIMVSVFGAIAFYDPYHRYNSIESAVYAALHRPAFDLGSVGIFFVCSYGYASFVRKLLNWSPWIPLSKLVYGVYLVHMQFQLRYAALFKNPRHFAYFDVIHLALADIVLSFAAALGLYLLIEAPCKNIFKELLVPRRVQPSKDNSNDIPATVTNGIRDSRL